MSIYIDWMVHQSIHLNEVERRLSSGARSPNRARRVNLTGAVVSTVKDLEWRNWYKRLLRSIRSYNWRLLVSR